MVLPPFTLFQFITTVAVCYNDGRNLLSLVESQSDSEFIVLVDSNFTPLGILDFFRLKNHYLANPHDSFFLEDFTFKEQIMTMVQATMSIEDFLPSLQDQSSQIFIIIDSQNRFLGILDQNKLFQFLIENYLFLSEKNHLLTKDLQQLTAKNIDLIAQLKWYNQLLASWSHQLKSPVTALVALSNLLQEKKIGSLNERQSIYAQQIYQSSSQLSGLFSLTIDFSSSSFDNLIIKPQPLEIKPFCEDICQELSTSFSINLEVNSSLNLMVVDKLQLRKILFFLLQNAINFTPYDGKIGLKVEAWSSWIVFTVWNFGCGISQENQLSLFSECQPLDNPLTGKFQGTGLELILSQQIAFANGGDISFISQIHQGSEFSLLLPPVFPPSLTSSSPLNFHLILILETDVSLISYFTALFRDLGYFTIVARSAIEAYRKAYQLKPYFIFLNYNLSFYDEINLFNLLKNDSVTQDLRFFYLKNEDNLPYLYAPNSQANLLLNKDNLSVFLEQFNLVNSEQNINILNNLVILLISPLNLNFEFNLSQYTFNLHHTIISCNSLQEAAKITQFWPIDLIILDGRKSPHNLEYWLNLQNYKTLINLPIITLDTQITSILNQLENVKIFPYLVSTKNDDFSDLFQVINIAISQSKNSIFYRN